MNGLSIELSFFDLLIIIGMVTGVICSILLFRKSDKKPSNKYIGLAILGFVWLNTKTLLHSLNLWEIHGIGFFPNSVELALPPLLYLYVVALTQSKLDKRKWLYFLPFAIFQTFAIVVYIAIMQTPVLAEKQVIANGLYFDDVKRIEEYLTLLSVAIYLYFAIRHIKTYKHWLSRNTSDNRFSELGFMKIVFYWVLVSCLYTIVNLILNQYLEDYHAWRWKISHLIIAGLVYYMGLVGYKNSDIVPKAFSVKPKEMAKKPNEKVDLDMISKLKHAIEIDKVHLNPKLSLQELAKMLDVNEGILSNTINAHYKKNFRSFINEERVNEVKRRLLNEGFGNLSLLGLANECGFNSEASFYRIFKATTGTTPKQFLAAHAS